MGSKGKQETLTEGGRIERIRELYDNGEPIGTIAQIFSCNPMVIVEELIEASIATVDEIYPDCHPEFITRDYEVIEYGPHQVGVHRLLMVIEHGFDALTSPAKVHHDSLIKWDNRSSVLVLCANSAEHQALHNQIEPHEDQTEIGDFRRKHDRINHSLTEFTAKGAGD